MRWSWGVYLAVGMALSIYTALGLVASKTTMIPLALQPGGRTEVSIFRFNPGEMRMDAWFRGKNRKELGGIDFSAFKEGRPGNHSPEGIARLEVEVRPSLQGPVRYKAAPASGFTSDRTARALGPIGPDGQLPKPKITLTKGINKFVLVVTSVDPALVGEMIEIWIEPALGIKRVEADVAWLGWSLLWQIYGVFYVIWGIFLLWHHRKSLNAR